MPEVVCWRDSCNILRFCQVFIFDDQQPNLCQQLEQLLQLSESSSEPNWLFIAVYSLSSPGHAEDLNIWTISASIFHNDSDR
ncbi:hypothetical protein DAPPUDRAFT_246516 [Daphnia pulex]|uniref:Uncharacterized protein n=1 Tax=Daphnia pulex TaxID=6669 RepID=E9GQQ5_DAPPU|nr:hypothetical protein DAPPUDRAFT_246516 [Daphnia pulex]|eukprot:EFX78154.1 hypothetical protein DAPPUDRAFT_246516 [Daphnia pulex]